MKLYNADHDVCACTYDAQFWDYEPIRGNNPLRDIKLSGNKIPLYANVFFFEDLRYCINGFDPIDDADLQQYKRSDQYLIFGIRIREHSAVWYELAGHKSGRRPDGYLIVNVLDWLQYCDREKLTGKQALFTRENIEDHLIGTLKALALYVNGWMYQAAAHDYRYDEHSEVYGLFEDEKDALQAAVRECEYFTGITPQYTEELLKKHVTYTLAV